MSFNLKSPVFVITIVSMVGAFFVIFFTLLIYAKCCQRKPTPPPRRARRRTSDPIPNVARTQEEIERRRQCHRHRNRTFNMPLLQPPYQQHVEDPPPAYLARARRPNIMSVVNLYARLEDLETMRGFCENPVELRAMDAEMLALRKWITRLEAQTESVQAMDSASDLASSRRGGPPVYTSEAGSVQAQSSTSRETRPKRTSSKAQGHNGR